MNKEYVNIRSLAQLQTEESLLKRRIKLSEKLLQKDYEQFKASFSLVHLISSAVKGVSRLTMMARSAKVGLSLLSLLVRKKKKE